MSVLIYHKQLNNTRGKMLPAVMHVLGWPKNAGEVMRMIKGGHKNDGTRSMIIYYAYCRRPSETKISVLVFV